MRFTVITLLISKAMNNKRQTHHQCNRVSLNCLTQNRMSIKLSISKKKKRKLHYLDIWICVLSFFFFGNSVSNSSNSKNVSGFFFLFFFFLVSFLVYRRFYLHVSCVSTCFFFLFLNFISETDLFIWYVS